MILLDTNILSALIQRRPDPTVVDWLNQQRADELWISGITIFEAHYGFESMADGKRRRRLEAAFMALVREDLGNRVLGFGQSAAAKAATLAAEQKAAGRPVDMRDTFIAGIAMANGATLVTGNTRHFDDVAVPVFDPWRATRTTDRA
ncbi:type II toxin-antitoxin system VapC family toxin [Spiribacter pallidus]|uniref:Ribonuclease VapC n=1 Tax=Spiribacter pallidus TaxID=1987936 RepID=A0ABV3TB00_9GAMM